MKHLLSRPWTILPFILIPVLVLSACQTAKEIPAPDVSQTPGAVTNEEVDIAFGSGPFSFLDTRAGLSDLTSYKATLTLTFDGTRDGQPSRWSKIYVMLTTRDPAAHQLTLAKTGDLSDLDAVFMAEVNEAAYERRGVNACNANIIEEGNSLSDRLEPAGFLNGVIGADEAGTETVNDVAVDHYTFDERSFGQSDIAKSTGEMWVASEGGYIVKYLVTSAGSADYFGEGIEGTLTWDYELTDINLPITFELPADCPAGLVNAPLLPDAANILNMPGILTYDTASSVVDAAAFYQEQITDFGWMLVGEPSITETSALMRFAQEDQIMTIIVSVGEAITVNIILGKTQ